MADFAEGTILGGLDDIEVPAMQGNRGIKLSKIAAKLKGSIDITSLLGKFQQLGFVKIVYNPSVDEEPLIQLTEQGLQQATELLLSLKPLGASERVKIYTTNNDMEELMKP